MKHYEALDKLEAMNGLDEVKQSAKEILAFIEIANKRKELGLKNTRQTNHFAFLGNPGTGKTTVARILGKLMIQMGVLKSGKTNNDDNDDNDDEDDDDRVPFIEISDSDISDMYVGGSERKLRDAFKRAEGGVLFIDEAYSLGGGKTGSSGSTVSSNKVISALLRFMEDYKDTVMVVVAGYPDKMNDFFDLNPGLRSRIPNQIIFPDYTIEQLVEIGRSMAHDLEYELTPEFEKMLTSILSKERKMKDFGNGRAVRNIIEKAIRRHSYRLVFEDQVMDSNDISLFKNLTPDDLGEPVKPRMFALV